MKDREERRGEGWYYLNKNYEKIIRNTFVHCYGILVSSRSSRRFSNNFLGIFVGFEFISYAAPGNISRSIDIWTIFEGVFVFIAGATMDVVK